MIKIDNIKTFGFETAVRAMRNPMNSWAKSDSGYVAVGEHFDDIIYKIGEKDLDLMRTLYNAGVEHRTYARMIYASMDITAPFYWWKEMDRYTIGKSQCSCSTMHTITKKPIELSDFSIDDFAVADEGLDLSDYFLGVVSDCETLRQEYLKSHDKKYWRGLIQLLPESYNQKRTISMSYETIFKIIKERADHKLTEWHDFIKVLKRLDYIEAITEG